jgi:hypothetical protein
MSEIGPENAGWLSGLDEVRIAKDGQRIQDDSDSTISSENQIY